MKKELYCQICGSRCQEYLDGDIKRQACKKCGFIYYKNPFPCVSVLVEDSNGRILLGKRGEESIYPGKWCLPCGYIEYEETFIEAAVREVSEETGITVKPQSIINVVSNRFDNGINSLVIVLLAKPETTAVTPGDDIISADWFSIDSELPELAFEADRYVINQYKCSKERNIRINSLDLNSCCF